MHPSTRQTLLALILGCALIAGFASPGLADSRDDLERERRGVTGELTDAQRSYDESSKEFADAAAALDSAQSALSVAESQLSRTRGELAVAAALDSQLQDELDRAERELAETEAQLTTKEAALAESEADVEQFAVESLQGGNRGLRAFSDLLRGESPSTFSERMSLNASLSEAQLAAMQDLQASRVILTLQREKVQDLRDEVEGNREAAARNLSRQQDLEVAAEAQTAEVGDLVQARTTASGEAAAIRDEDEASVQALESERERLGTELRALAERELAEARRQAERERAEEARRKAAEKNDGGGSGGGGGGSSGGSGGSGGGGNSGGSGGSSGGNTSAMQRPVSGPITSPYGMRRHPITGVYKLHDGTDFAAACGTPIRAAASGKIIQQYFNAGYGNRVIVSNGVIRGKSIATTYNHLSRFARGVGASVSRGEIIGYVGTTGMSTGCHLHFMVIANGGVTNPMGWLS